MKTLDFASFEAQCSELSETELRGIIDDCQTTLNAWPSQPNAGFCLDQQHVAIAAIRKQKRAS